MWPLLPLLSCRTLNQNTLWMCRGQRSISGPPLCCHILIFETESLSGLGLHKQARLTGGANPRALSISIFQPQSSACLISQPQGSACISQPQESACLHLPTPGLCLSHLPRQTPPCLAFYMDSGGLNLDPYDHEAIPLLTELLPQLLSQNILVQPHCFKGLCIFPGVSQQVGFLGKHSRYRSLTGSET